jgi:hypothetical protein
MRGGGKNTGLESKYFYKVSICNVGKHELSSLTEYVNIYDVADETCLAASVFSFHACDWEIVSPLSALCYVM